MLYLTLRQYEYIVAVADAGGLTEAASVLNVSQPSLSNAITRVEDRLGTRLFVRRKGTAIIITPFGHRFVAQARTLLSQANQLETGGAGLGRPYVVACFEDIAPWYLARAHKALSTSLPNTPFAIREGRFESLAADLREGRADIALSYDIGFDSGFERVPFRQIHPYACTTPDHPIAGLASLDLPTLAQYPLILSTEDLSVRHMMTLFRAQGLTAQIAHRTASLEMMRSLAAQGAGVGVSYSVPPADVSYDGFGVTSVPIIAPKAAADLVWLRSPLNTPHPAQADIMNVLGRL